MTFTELLIQQAQWKKKFFENPIYYARLILYRAEEIFGKSNTRIFLFGSIVKGNYTLSSDIDVLVVAPPVPPENKAGILTALKQDLEFASPFNIILCDASRYERWFKKYILDECLEITSESHA
jgi:predicted nucleotidyltransferase